MPTTQHREAIEKSVEPIAAVRAFPNPTKTYFVIDTKGMTSKEKAELKIYDGLGKLVEVKTVVANQTLVIGSLYRPGIYVAVIQQGKERFIIRLVKQSQ